MNSRLDIELKLIDSVFYAVDNSDYEGWISEGIFDAGHPHFAIQRLIAIKSDENNHSFSTASKLAETIEDLQENWIVENMPDNLYYYQKILIPTREHTFATTEKLYYDVADGKVYYEDEGIEQVVFDNPTSDDSFDEIYNLVKTHDIGNCFYFDDYFMMIDGLIKCYVFNEKERLKLYIKNNCRNNCTEYTTLNTKSDILLAAILVINDLIDKEEFFEAQKILNSLDTCGTLCRDFNKISNNCGCGKI